MLGGLLLYQFWTYVYDLYVILHSDDFLIFTFLYPRSFSAFSIFFSVSQHFPFFRMQKPLNQTHDIYITDKIARLDTTVAFSPPIHMALFLRFQRRENTLFIVYVVAERNGPMFAKQALSYPRFSL